MGDTALFISFCQRSRCHSVQQQREALRFLRPALRSSAADSLIMLVRRSPCRLSLAGGSSLLFAVKKPSHKTQHVCKSATECHIAFASNRQMLPSWFSAEPSLAASGEPSRSDTFRAKTHLERDRVHLAAPPPITVYPHAYLNG